ncbi:MAG: barnase inhibitor [Ruminococcaceae bacterium]|nr:barnase inhibitor [Oscillospiraceae bacterium]
MMYALIDGAAVNSRSELHDALARQLALPEHYGRNLDALFDCLTDIHEPCDIVLRSPDELFAHLGVYADILQNVLHDAACENSSLHFTVEG